MFEYATHCFCLSVDGESVDGQLKVKLEVLIEHGKLHIIKQKILHSDYNLFFQCAI
jgi:hypothetical protein